MKNKKLIKDFDISSFKMSGGMIGGGGVDPPTTTKGDISGFDTTYARVPIGADDQVLTADSAEALGLAWKTAGGGATVTNQNTINNTSRFELGTSYSTLMTITLPNRAGGKYMAQANANYSVDDSNVRWIAFGIFQNGVLVQESRAIMDDLTDNSAVIGVVATGDLDGTDLTVRARANISAHVMINGHLGTTTPGIMTFSTIEIS